MASRVATQAAKDTLTKAILGFKGATAGQREHQETNDHLEKVLAAAKAGRKSPDDDSPGRREVGLAAHQREIPMERNHEGGGNVLSNEDGAFGAEFARDPDRPGEIAPSNRGEDRKLTSAAAVKSDGHLRAAQRTSPESAGPPGAVSFRTLAAKKAGEQINEPSVTSGGNRKSVNPAPPARETPRVGEAPTPAKAGFDKNPGEYEETPKYIAKERLGKDQYERAAEGVRKLLKAPRR